MISKLLVFASIVTNALAVSEFSVQCPTVTNVGDCLNFGTDVNPEILAMPSEVYEFNNDIRNCIVDVTQSECSTCSGYCDAQDGYGSQAYYCDDVTNDVQTAFQAIASGTADYFDWMSAGSTGCNVRAGGQLTGNEYYRLACSCSTDSSGVVYIDGYWKVYYFAESTCSTLVAESAWTYSGQCGSASSVSVSLFASLVAVFAALKSM